MESRGVRIPGKERGSGAGAAAGQHVDEIKDGYRDHRLVDQHDQQRRLEQRQDHVAKPLPGAGPIHGGGIDDIRGDDLQAGEEEDGRQRKLPPDMRHDDGAKGELPAREPRNIAVHDSELEQETVEGPEVTVQEQPPDDAGRDEGNGPGKQDQSSQDAEAPDGLIEQQGHR